jgi:thiamine biosynthesis lipoprotein
MPRAALGSALVAALLLAPGCRDAGKDGARQQGEQAPARGEPAEDEARAEAAELVRKDGTIFAETELMGTRVSINLWVGQVGDPLAASQAITDAMQEIARIESIASEWRESSDLSRLNRSAGEAVELPEELVEILERAAEISADTDGLFDVSFYAVGQLWRFEPGSKPPSAEAIAAHLPSVDWRAIEIDPKARTVRLTKEGMKIGLGAIAKGYAVDRASALLHARGFANHIVEAGGDTQVSGQKGDKPWRVGVQDPNAEAGRVGHIIAKDEAVVTSGNYARFFEWEGVHYTHILDPRSGWPIRAGESPKSVTLVAGNATEADAYCTAVSVMKPEEGLAFVEARPKLEAVIIGPDDVLHVSSGLRDRFVDERE